jgi:hypothetical protein
MAVVDKLLRNELLNSGSQKRHLLRLNQTNSVPLRYASLCSTAHRFDFGGYASEFAVLGFSQGL